MSVRRSLILLTLVSVLLPVGVFLMSSQQEARQEANRIQTREATQTYTVQQGIVLITVPAIGTIRAQQVVDVSFLVSGQVAEIPVHDGDYVEAGTPLIQLKNRAQVIRFDQANLSYETAVRQYQDLTTVDENDLKVAQANVQSAQGQYSGVANAVSPETVQAAQLQYDQALVAVDGAQKARQNASPTLSDESIALLDAKVGEATFNAEIARLHLEDLQSSNSGELGAAGARINQAQQQLAQVQAGASQFDLDQAQVTIDQAQMQLDQAQLNYDRTILIAPFAGVVSGLNVEVGQRINGGVPLVQIVDVTPMTLKGTIDEVDLRQVSTGMDAQVEMDALPNTLLDASIDQIAPAGTAQNGLVSYDITLNLNTLDDRIRPGMTAQANIIVQQENNVLIVPNRFVQEDREHGTYSVNILMPDDTLQPRTVTIGLRGDDYTEIKSGLKASEIVGFLPPQKASAGPFGGQS
jgi:HlyD family secretion protein